MGEMARHGDSGGLKISGLILLNLLVIGHVYVASFLLGILQDRLDYLSWDHVVQTF